MLDPKFYGVGCDVQYQVSRNFLQEIKENISFDTKERILDVGCGTGKVTADLLLPILPDDAELVGGDFQIMIDYASKNNLKDRLTYKVIDIEDVSLKTKWQGSSFDKTFSFFCEHWIKDHSMSFSNYYYLLKPGGRLFMTLANYNNTYGQIEKDISMMPKWKEYTKIIEKFSHLNNIITNIDKMYRKILEEEKFVVDSLELNNVKQVFDNMEQYLSFSKGISLVVPCLPGNLIDSYMDEYVKLAMKYKLISVEKTKNRVIMDLGILYIQAYKC